MGGVQSHAHAAHKVGKRIHLCLCKEGGNLVDRTAHIKGSHGSEYGGQRHLAHIPQAGQPVGKSVHNSGNGSADSPHNDTACYQGAHQRIDENGA